MSDVLLKELDVCVCASTNVPGFFPEDVRCESLNDCAFVGTLLEVGCACKLT